MTSSITADEATITAVATPPGQGGIAVVRLSGSQAFAIGAQIAGQRPAPRQATLCRLRDTQGVLIDQGIVIFFPGPASFTGEDVVEFQVHGGLMVCDWLVQTALALGARAASPGEFSQRAFLNNKIDLAQAEAIADLIASGSREAAQAAMRSLDGAFSEAVHELLGHVIHVRVHIEAGIDFPDDEIDLHDDAELKSRLATVGAGFQTLRREARQGQVLRDGLAVVIAGPPNAGKSSLLNQLAGQDAAIVTDVPGTTRDPLREHIAIDGMPLLVVDTAGLRDSTDTVEAEGVRRAHRELGRADRALWVADARDGAAAARKAARNALPTGLPVTLVLNKIDLMAEAPDLNQHDDEAVVRLSALTGAGLDLLREHLKSAAGFQTEVIGAFSARRRHLDALVRAEAAFGLAQRRFADADYELAAEDLRAAQNALGEITGAFTSEDLLGEIFAGFCIGK
jgi:tRNA modification GTPase